MDKELRILILEDAPVDAELEEHELRKAGLIFTSKVVDTRENFLKALDEFLPDLILSDYELPAFDGLAALRIAKEKCPDVPFILVSGKLGEEFAIENLKEGATDYVLKNNLKRLVPSVKRALKEAKERTERKRAEEALKEEMLRRSVLMDKSLDGIAILNQEHELVEANQRFAEMLGYTPKEIIGLHPWDWQAVMTEEEIRANFSDLTKINVVFETRHRRKDGKIFDVEVSASGTKVGDKPMVFSIYRDITERKRAEEMLKDSEARYSIMANALPNVVLVHKNGIIHYINEFGLSITGYNKDEVMGKSMFEFLSDDSKELAVKNMQRRISGEHVENYELKVITKSKDIKHFLVDAAIIPYEKERAFLIVLSDITERKRAEEALKEREELYRLLFNNVSDAIILHEISPNITEATRFRIIEANDIASQYYGYTREELLQMDVRELDAPEAPGNTTTLNTLFTEGRATWEGIHLHKDGHKIPVEISNKLFNLHGKPMALASARDIIERKQAEEKIKMLSSVVEQSTEGMAIADLDGKLTFVNEAWCKMHGYKSPKELIGKRLAISHNKEQIENEVKPFNKKVIELGSYSGEVGHITKDGKPFPTLMVTTLLKDKQGKPYALAGIAKDITEHKRAEKEIQKKMKELEDFYNIAIGRELRMKELKEQMEAMKKK